MFLTLLMSAGLGLCLLCRAGLCSRGNHNLPLLVGSYATILPGVSRSAPCHSVEPGASQLYYPQDRGVEGGARRVRSRQAGFQLLRLLRTLPPLHQRHLARGAPPHFLLRRLRRVVPASGHTRHHRAFAPVRPWPRVLPRNALPGLCLQLPGHLGPGPLPRLRHPLPPAAHQDGEDHAADHGHEPLPAHARVVDAGRGQGARAARDRHRRRCLGGGGGALREDQAAADGALALPLHAGKQPVRAGAARFPAAPAAAVGIRLGARRGGGVRRRAALGGGRARVDQARGRGG
mmetsp:Transcript_30631/g.81888  ORF Transcript_30631/g.81888 Transcript_30631/m.81888 type:complete len:290 (-) Transcript_30631:83-952(-)